MKPILSVLAGCTTKSGVVSARPDTYLVTHYVFREKGDGLT